ncbi:leucine-rich repeat domain-containing protein [Desulfoscipio gibsoniae]|uniref:Leucine-rich repeat domain-containing protein n=1 Tax=Desulfoscipio gibsoniae DSM 7213 TaxID=767817 RepID=R4KSF4_9FIRM|nr:leucine-rich repeat domain-containing protein [Desulfoscipio gibsoniae]AGL02511.1 hypothetical protein Desgi_3156 [Desulfoscipio gibsoniae DSM 7213]
MKFLPRTVGMLTMMALLVVALSSMGCTGETNTGDFVVKNGVLTRYAGADPVEVGDSPPDDIEVGMVVNIPDNLGITAIGGLAFSYRPGISEVTIPKGVVSIGEGAFGNCTGLASVTIPDTLESIGNGAFAGCSSLTSVSIPDSVTSIGPSAFSDCSSLASVTMGSGVTSIGNHAFSGTKLSSPVIINDGKTLYYVPPGLTSYTIPDTVTTINDYAFSN